MQVHTTTKAHHQPTEHNVAAASCLLCLCAHCQASPSPLPPPQAPNHSAAFAQTGPSSYPSHWTHAGRPSTPSFPPGRPHFHTGPPPQQAPVYPWPLHCPLLVCHNNLIPRLAGSQRVLMWPISDQANPVSPVTSSYLRAMVEGKICSQDLDTFSPTLSFPGHCQSSSMPDPFIARLCKNQTATALESVLVSQAIDCHYGRDTKMACSAVPQCCHSYVSWDAFFGAGLCDAAAL